MRNKWWILSFKKKIRLSGIKQISHKTLWKIAFTVNMPFTALKLCAFILFLISILPMI